MILDLFCGAGGADLGLRRAGHQSYGIDIDPVAVATLHASGGRGEVADLSDQTIRSRLADYKPEGIWSSPPCQKYSRAGNGTGHDGWPDTLAIVQMSQPTWIIVENVIGCPIVDWKNDLVMLNYKVEYRQIDAADYGLPQHRNRLILQARRDHIPIWPAPTHAHPDKPLLGLKPWEHSSILNEPMITITGASGHGLGSKDSRQWLLKRLGAANLLGKNAQHYRDSRPTIRSRATLDKNTST
jgi:DNA (cytosine-5)-methyltransferase 1